MDDCFSKFYCKCTVKMDLGDLRFTSNLITGHCSSIWTRWQKAWGSTIREFLMKRQAKRETLFVFCSPCFSLKFIFLYFCFILNLKCLCKFLIFIFVPSLHYLNNRKRLLNSSNSTSAAITCWYKRKTTKKAKVD